MTEESAQAVDDGEAEAKSFAVMFGIAEPIKLAEYLLALILRNSRPRIPDFDAQLFAPFAAADQNSPLRRIVHRIGHKIEQNLFQKHKVTADPCVTRDNPKVQARIGRVPS